MIVCSLTFDKKKVISLDGDIEGMREYVKSLIPPRYQHNTALVSNQLYYINTEILKDKELTQEKRNSISDTLVTDIQVCGYLDQMISIQGLERLVKENKVREIEKRERNKI